MTEKRKMTVVPSLIAVAMLLFAVLELPYGYYKLLRWVICGISGFLAYTSYGLNKKTWVWIMGITAILFNPLIPVHLDKETWIGIDVFVAIIYLISTVFIKEKINKEVKK